MRNEKGAYGFDASTDEYTDMIKAGIIDPTKVVRLALQNAASVASLMITTEALIADKPEKKAPYPANASGWWNGWNGWNGRHVLREAC